MGTMRLFKVWLLICLMVLSGGSLSYAQTNTFPADGNVGIGTTVPGSALHVRTSSGEAVIRAESLNLASFQAVQLGDGLGGVHASAVFEVINENSPLISRRLNFELFNQSTTGSITFHTANESTPKMVINSSGNVGIGTTSPTSKLHVSGNANVTGDLTVDGNIAAKYQDVAEWVRTPA